MCSIIQGLQRASFLETGHTEVAIFNVTVFANTYGRLSKCYFSVDLLEFKIERYNMHIFDLIAERCRLSLEEISS